jgi:hypothetical protein
MIDPNMADMEQVADHESEVLAGLERRALADRVRQPAEPEAPETMLRSALSDATDKLAALVEAKQNVLAEIKDARGEVELMTRAVAVFDRWHERDQTLDPLEDDHDQG